MAPSTVLGHRYLHALSHSGHLVKIAHKIARLKIVHSKRDLPLVLPKMGPAPTSASVLWGALYSLRPSYSAAFWIDKMNLSAGFADYCLEERASPFARTVVNFVPDFLIHSSRRAMIDQARHNGAPVQAGALQISQSPAPEGRSR